MGWIGGLSDHSPIYLEIVGHARKPKAPFKFNATWLKDSDYIRLVSNFWKAHPPDSSRSISEGISNNLLRLKQLTIDWAYNKREMDDLKLHNIEAKLANLEDANGLDIHLLMPKPTSLD